VLRRILDPIKEASANPSLLKVATCGGKQNWLRLNPNEFLARIDFPVGTAALKTAPERIRLLSQDKVDTPLTEMGLRIWQDESGAPDPASRSVVNPALLERSGGREGGEGVRTPPEYFGPASGSDTYPLSRPRRLEVLVVSPEVLRLFDEEVRQNPEGAAGYRTERLGSLIRVIGPKEHYILYAHLLESEAADVIARQTAEFRAMHQLVEWKVYSHDQPVTLGGLLQGAGWVSSPPESLMLFDLSEPVASSPLPPQAEIRRVRGREALSDVESVDQAAFGRVNEFLRQNVAERLDNPNLAQYVAYWEGVPVSAGRVETRSGGSFASLFGGGTIPAFRGRGLYRALVAERARFAREQGARYVLVGALDGTSRPILERVGFVRIAGIVCWELRPTGE
jgi:predicted GNAT family acetyltransferase